MYTAYGLSIFSEFPIPELSAASDGIDTPDIRIHRSDLPRDREAHLDEDGRAYHRGAGDILYVKERCGRFLIRDGAQILVDPDPAAEERVWRLSLFGPALALLLIQRGYLVLHGGAIAFRGGTALLLGPGGAGKSTLTAELCRQGGGLLTDDVVAIDASTSPPRVMPGIPLMKLWPESVDWAPPTASTTVLHPEFSKLGHRLDDDSLASPSPVGRIYILASGDRLEAEPISGIMAFKALTASLFAVRYGDAFISSLDGQYLLDMLTRLLGHSSVTVLRRPRDLRLVSKTAALIVADHAQAGV